MSAQSRSAWAATEIMLGVTLAHSAAGGTLPDVPWLLGLAALVYGATLVVLRGWASPVVMLGLLGAGQAVLHLLLGWLAPAHQHATHAPDPAALTWQMALAHAASAALTAVVWAVRRQLGRVVAWSAAGGPLPVWGAPADVRGRAWTPARVWLGAVALRGPPAPLSA